jgi:hypothetical protein
MKAVLKFLKDQIKSKYFRWSSVLLSAIIYLFLTILFFDVLDDYFDLARHSRGIAFLCATLIGWGVIFYLSVMKLINAYGNSRSSFAAATIQRSLALKSAGAATIGLFSIAASISYGLWVLPLQVLALLSAIDAIVLYCRLIKDQIGEQPEDIIMAAQFILKNTEDSGTLGPGSFDSIFEGRHAISGTKRSTTAEPGVLPA